MNSPINSYPQLPPGFRFHPTDEELVNYYLRKKVALEKFELDVIAEIDLNKLEPWDLHERCKTDLKQAEWFFFSYKDKKYPTGTRTNRATVAGFWKATGRDKPVYSNNQQIGMRKTLVFYMGRAPHGQKTDWIMHEYRMDENKAAARRNEGWVICRVFEKRSYQHKDHSNATENEDSSSSQKVGTGGNCVGHYSASNHPLIACKQEHDIEDSVLTQDTYLQLPELESPKMSSNDTRFYPSVDLKKILIENCRTAQLFSAEPTGMAYSRSFLSEDSFMDHADNRHIAEWNLVDNNISKEMRLTRNNYLPENQCTLQEHGEQHREYAVPASYEMDLWNFGRY